MGIFYYTLLYVVVSFMHLQTYVLHNSVINKYTVMLCLIYYYCFIVNIFRHFTIYILVPLCSIGNIFLFITQAVVLVLPCSNRELNPLVHTCLYLVKYSFFYTSFNLYCILLMQTNSQPNKCAIFVTVFLENASGGGVLEISINHQK